MMIYPILTTDSPIHTELRKSMIQIELSWPRVNQRCVPLELIVIFQMCNGESSPYIHYIYILIHNMTYTHTYTWHIFFFPLYSLNMLQYTSIYKLYASENHFNWSCMWAWARVTFAPSTSSQQKALKQGLFSAGVTSSYLNHQSNGGWAIWNDIKSNKTQRQQAKQKEFVNKTTLWSFEMTIISKFKLKMLIPKEFRFNFFWPSKNTKPTPNEQLLPFFEPTIPHKELPNSKMLWTTPAFLPRSCFFGGIWPSTHWTWKMATTNFHLSNYKGFKVLKDIFLWFVKKHHCW